MIVGVSVVGVPRGAIRNISTDSAAVLVTGWGKHVFGSEGATDWNLDTFFGQRLCQDVLTFSDESIANSVHGLYFRVTPTRDEPRDEPLPTWTTRSR